MSEAFAQVQALRPDAYAEVVELELVAGSLQTVPIEYAALVVVHDVVDKDSKGNVYSRNEVSEIKIDNTGAVKLFGAYGCETLESGVNNVNAYNDAGNCVVKPGSEKEPTIRTFRKNQHAPRTFNVTPPIPKGQTVLVQATVVKNPPCVCDIREDICIPVGIKFSAPILDWVMYRVLSGEFESEHFTRGAQRYEQSFYRSIRNNYLQDSRFNSGYNNDGDPNVTARASGAA
jgi:hypothetical protein